MQYYKNYRVYTTAVSANGVWRGRGVVLDLHAKVTRALQRIETVSDLLFLTKEEAEDFALKLCKSWIDRSASGSVI